MTEFGNYLSAIMASSGETAAAFAQRLGIDSGNLSRIVNGSQINMRISTLERICTKATKDEETQVHLIAAYLRDFRVGPGKNRIRVTVTNSKGKPRGATDKNSSNLISLIRSSNPTEKFTEDLTVILSAYEKSKSMRSAFHSLASIAGEIA